jgi:hypothetical protein
MLRAASIATVARSGQHVLGSGARLPAHAGLGVRLPSRAAQQKGGNAGGGGP